MTLALINNYPVRILRIFFRTSDPEVKDNSSSLWTWNKFHLALKLSYENMWNWGKWVRFNSYWIFNYDRSNRFRLMRPLISIVQLKSMSRQFMWTHKGESCPAVSASRTINTKSWSKSLKLPMGCVTTHPEKGLKSILLNFISI